ncbi:MAG: dethiobiotin synthase [Verrucomicrobiales bacterium]|nr:dethiobiotin synthase [Verrucomicrobiales bacterium]
MPPKRPRATLADPGPPFPSGRVLVVTGTDTGVGKTVVAGLLVRALRGAGIDAIGLKPVCSGGREDAIALQAAAGGVLGLDAVNPWSFSAALAPAVAARRAGKTVTLTRVLTHIRRLARCHEVTVVEGAGGLLSPLGEDFDSRDLIRALRAIPVVVCPNRLGAINQSLLVWEALSRRVRPRARLALLEPLVPDGSQRSNVSLLRRRLGRDRVILLPRFSEAEVRDPEAVYRRVRRALVKVVRGFSWE